MSSFQIIISRFHQSFWAELGCYNHELDRRGDSNILAPGEGGSAGGHGPWRVCEGGTMVESWSLFEALISLGVGKGSNFSRLLGKMFEKKKTWLLCLCIKKICDFQPLDLKAAMKLFLSLPTSESTKEIKSD